MFCLEAKKPGLGRRERIWFGSSREDRAEGGNKKKYANALQVMIKDCCPEKGAKLTVCVPSVGQQVMQKDIRTNSKISKLWNRWPRRPAVF